MTAPVSPQMIRILIADDHPMLREGLAGVIRKQPDMAVVAEASNGAEAVQLYREILPDITLMDLQMPGLDGVQAIAAIHAEFPNARIIVLTTYAGDVRALRALRAGASGFLLKSAIRSELLSCIRTVHEGQRHLPPEVAQEIAMHAIDGALSDREVEILNLVSAGHGNKQIAWRLQISEETVKTHLRSIFAKLHVADRTHAVSVAAKRGIIDL